MIDTATGPLRNSTGRRRTLLLLVAVALLFAPALGPGAAAQDLVTELDVPGASSTPEAGSTISVTDLTINVSVNTVGPSTTGIYLSATSTFDGSAMFLASRAVPQLGPGERNRADTTFALPAGQAGLRFIFVVADFDNAVAETNEGNNVSAGRAITIGADLTVSIDVPGSVTTALPGATVTVSDRTSNDNSAPAGASTTRYFLVRGTTLDLATARPIGSRTVPALGPSATNTGPATVTLPADAAGTFRIIAKADADDAVFEANEGNNVSPASFSFELGPDLIVALDLPGSASMVAAGATVSLTDITRNRGRAPVETSTTRFYLSADANLDAGDIVLGSREIPALPANTTGTSDESTGTTPLTIPAGIAGVYRILALADADNARAESNEANNVAVSSPIAVGPDLMVTGTTVPPRAAPGTTIFLSDVTKNGGAGAASPSSTGYYLSRDPVLDPWDVFLGSRAMPAIGAGSHSVDTTTVAIPDSTPPDCYFVIAVADALQAVAESDEGNNALAKAIHISPSRTVTAACANRDFNGDGKSDILWRHSSGHVGIWLMDGTTMLNAGIPASPGVEWRIDGAGDFDGNGKVDILWRETLSGAVAIWLMDGTSLVSGTILSVNPGLEWRIEEVGDFNRDGKADILWRETSSGAVAIWLMDGTSLVSGTVLSVNPGLEWRIDGVGDFNRDGKADILWRETSSGAVAIWLMDGTSLVSGTILSVNPGLGWRIDGVGDFNGDGKADILWRETSSGAVGIWLMEGTSISSAGIPASPTLDWTIQAVGDFDGDRKADILWRDATGQVVIWLMDGTTILDEATPASVDLEWTIE